MPIEHISWEALLAAHRLGVKSGRALRIFHVPEGSTVSLEHLVESGKAEISGDDPFASARDVSREIVGVDLPTVSRPSSPRICDTLIPSFEPECLWRLSGERHKKRRYRQFYPSSSTIVH